MEPGEKTNKRRDCEMDKSKVLPGMEGDQGHIFWLWQLEEPRGLRDTFKEDQHGNQTSGNREA